MPAGKAGIHSISWRNGFPTAPFRMIVVGLETSDEISFGQWQET
jgi:hypothetical protein